MQEESSREPNPLTDPLTDPMTDPLTDETPLVPGEGQPSALNPYQTPTAQVDLPAASGDVDFTGLRLTRIGLLVVYYGVCCILFAFGGGIVAGLLSEVLQLGYLAYTFNIALVVFVFGGYVAAVVGQFMCCSVPSHTGAKGFAFAAAGVHIVTLMSTLGVFVSVLFLAGPLAGANSNRLDFLSPLVGILNSVLTVAGYVCFLMFMKRVAEYLQRRDLATTAVSVTRMLFGSLFALVVTPIVVAVFSLSIGFAFLGFLMLGALIFFVVTFVRYLNLVSNLAHAIPK